MANGRLAPSDICCSQAFGIKAEDVGARLLIAARFCAAPLQDEKQQAKRYGFWRLWIIHVLVLSPLEWAHRASSQPGRARVLPERGYRFGFEPYQRGFA